MRTTLDGNVPTVLVYFFSPRGRKGFDSGEGGVFVAKRDDTFPQRLAFFVFVWRVLTVVLECRWCGVW